MTVEQGAFPPHPCPKARAEGVGFGGSVARRRERGRGRRVARDPRKWRVLAEDWGAQGQLLGEGVLVGHMFINGGRARPLWLFTSSDLSGLLP